MIFVQSERGEALRSARRWRLLASISPCLHVTMTLGTSATSPSGADEQPRLARAIPTARRLYSKLEVKVQASHRIGNSLGMPPLFPGDSKEKEGRTTCDSARIKSRPAKQGLPTQILPVSLTAATASIGRWPLNGTDHRENRIDVFLFFHAASSAWWRSLGASCARGSRPNAISAAGPAVRPSSRSRPPTTFGAPRQPLARRGGDGSEVHRLVGMREKGRRRARDLAESCVSKVMPHLRCALGPLPQRPSFLSSDRPGSCEIMAGKSPGTGHAS